VIAGVVAAQIFEHQYVLQPVLEVVDQALDQNALAGQSLQAGVLRFDTGY
jgi:hypothetical protein